MRPDDLFYIPRFLHRRTVQETVAERGCSEAQAMRMLFDDEYNGVPLPRVRRRGGE